MSKLVACSFVIVLGAACATETPRFAFNHSENLGHIGNGMKVVLMPDSTTQLVEVDVRWDVGAREDPPGKAGLAHLVEHLMFQTRPDGPQTEPLFHTIIDIATDFNAYTNWDTTHYRMTSRAENLDALLKIEAMRMFYGCSTVPEPEFEREREVVRNEIRAQSSAENYVVQLVEAAIYPHGHAYERMVGGNDQQIASATLKDACEFMQKYYTPDRATLLIAGGFEEKQAQDLVQKWFGRIPARKPAPRVPVEKFTPTAGRHEIQADVERPAVWVGWALPAANTDEGYAAQFGIGAAFSRIAQAGQEYNFAYSVEPAVLGGELAPVFFVRIELKGLDKLDEALDFVQKSVKQASRGWDGGTGADIEEEKNREKARFIQGVERLSDRTEEVARLVQFSTDIDFNAPGNNYLFHRLDKIAKFDAETVSAAVKNSLDWDKASIIIVKPNKEGIKGDTRSKVTYQAKSDAAMTNATVDPREAKKPLKVSSTLKGLADVQKFTLGNGLNVELLPVHSMPLIAANLMFKNAGEAASPNNPLLAGDATEFLDSRTDIEGMMEGTDALQVTGTRVGCMSTLDAAICQTHNVNIYLDVMLKALERKITVGEYNQEQIEQWQKSEKEQLKLHSTQEENEYVRQVYTALFGADHPYTKSAYETAENIGRIDRDSLDKFRKEHFTATNATLIVVGDFEPKRAEKLIRETFGDWGKGKLDQPVDTKPAPRTGPIYVGVVKSKDDQQITATIAYPAPAGIDGQEGARRILAEMLDYRAADVRFKLGSTYGLYMARQPHVGPTGYLMRGGAVIGGTMDAERAGESIKALREGFDMLRKGENFDEDFVRARRKLVSTMLSESTVTTELAQRLGFISTYGLDPSYYNTLLQQMAAVSPAQIKALIAQELDPKNEIIVILGDKAHLDKAFADAGITDVKIVQPEYK